MNAPQAQNARGTSEANAVSDASRLGRTRRRRVWSDTKEEEDSNRSLLVLAYVVLSALLGEFDARYLCKRLLDRVFVLTDIFIVVVIRSTLFRRASIESASKERLI